MSKNGDVEPPVDPWSESIDVTLRRAGSRPEGLSEDEARSRLAKDGPNALARKKPRPAWKKFLDQFKNVLVVVLMGAAGVAGAVGDLTDAVVIVAVVLFNGCLGYFQEHRAEATLAALENMLAQHANVRRAGAVLTVGSRDLVVGDVVLLAAGDRVPADGRVLEAHSAEVAEAALTGESHAIAKQAGALPAGPCSLGERSNMVFMNTVVNRGRLEMVVCATGMNTEMGRITGLLDKAVPRPTPLQTQLDGLGKHLAIIAGAVVALVFGLGLWRGEPVVHTIMISVALAVAAIPEGLPAVVTVTLAIGMRRMAKNSAIVKRLAAVETLGSTTVICSDKTGTLTLNEMTARELYFAGRSFIVQGEGYWGEGTIAAADARAIPDLLPVLTPAVLCNESSITGGKLVGDPTEGALIALAMKGGIAPLDLTNRTPRIAEIPFDSAHKFMATFHRVEETSTVTMLVKGAPDVLLALADRQLGETGEARLDDATRAALSTENERLGRLAMRVLAVARRDIPIAELDPAGDLMIWAKDLCMLGLVGIVDPPRPEARDAIRLCRKAGIQVKMITGDSAITAAAIARQLGLDGEVLSGADLDALDVARLSDQIERTAVFARVAPEHKVKIVNALQARGHVVAMTGDGVNDAPALEHADIGVAMGVTGTEVAKDAASMVLTDDNFATIVGAVKEGRTIYENIVKFVRFQLSTNVGAILTVLGAQIVDLPTPFTAIQILWINVIMDGPPAMTLGLEPPRPGIMDEGPRNADARILTLARFAKLAAFGAVMAAGTLGVFVYARSTGEDPDRAKTLAFTTFVLFQLFNVFNARAEYGTAFHRRFFANRKLWLSLACVIAFQLVAVHVPAAQQIFHTTSLALADWGLALAVGSSILLLEEATKVVRRLLAGPRGQLGAPPAIGARLAS
jgi:Ca2+-transporting ATPase